MGREAEAVCSIALGSQAYEDQTLLSGDIGSHEQ